MLTKFNQLSMYVGLIFREMNIYIKNRIRGIIWNWDPANLIAYWSFFLIKLFEKIRG